MPSDPPPPLLGEGERLTDDEIRHEERLRIAALLDASKELLVDFTEGSTVAALELVVFLLKLGEPSDA